MSAVAADVSSPGVQVYSWPDYRTDLVVATSMLGAASLLLVISALVSGQKETDKIDHL